MIKWVIPDCDKLRQLNFWALRYFADHKDECTPNSKVFAAYGVLHDTILSGGRVTIKESRLGTENQIRTVLSLYQEYGVEYRLVFSNSLIKEEHLTDYWANLQLRLVEEYGGGVIIASDILKNYIKEKYPKLKLISSTTKLNTEENFLKECASGEYATVVLNTKHNYNYDFIPKEYRHLVEILVDDCCPPDCMYRKTCYIRCSMRNMGMYAPGGCRNKAKHAISNISSHKYNYIVNTKKFLRHYTVEDINKAHEDGFELFKFTGREQTVIENLIHMSDYMIKPEYTTPFIMNALFELDLLKEEELVY